MLMLRKGEAYIYNFFLLNFIKCQHQMSQVIIYECAGSFLKKKTKKIA